MRVLRRRSPRPGLIGRVEGVIDGRLQGWAHDRARADRPLRLRFEAGDLVLAVDADRYRADVHRAGHGDGACGFALPVHRLGAAELCRVFDDAGGAELPGSPVRLAVTHRPVLDLDADDLAFRLDGARPAAGLTGFVVDRAEPTRRPRLGLTSGGRLLAGTGSTLWRADAEALAPDGLRGFAFAGRDGPERSLDIVDLGSGRILAHLVKGRLRARWTARRPHR